MLTNNARTYKVVELNIVTDETIEDTLNTWTKQGWIFDSLHFAMGTGSKRPSMGFVFFVRTVEADENRKGGEKSSYENNISVCRMFDAAGAGSL